MPFSLAISIMCLVPCDLPSQKATRCVAVTSMFMFLRIPAILGYLSQFAGYRTIVSLCSLAYLMPKMSAPSAIPEMISIGWASKSPKDSKVSSSFFSETHSCQSHVLPLQSPCNYWDTLSWWHVWWLLYLSCHLIILCPYSCLLIKFSAKLDETWEKSLRMKKLFIVWNELTQVWAIFASEFLIDIQWRSLILIKKWRS